MTPSLKTWLIPLAALVILALVPIFAIESFTRHLFIIAFIYAMIASNWNLSLGHCGVFNFGHLTFFGTGVYVTGIAAKSLGVDPWLAIPLGGVAATGVHGRTIGRAVTPRRRMPDSGDGDT